MSKISLCFAGLVAALTLPCGADVFTVTTTNDTGDGSLRDAITTANNTTALDTIEFAITNITATGVKTITPLSQLPPITQPVIIDGYTQPGSSSNTLANADNAVLLVEISGATLGNNGDGLQISGGGSGSTIRGLVIDNGFGAAIRIKTTINAVEGCFLGTDPSGLIAHANSSGVIFDSEPNASLNRIGGTSPGQRNIISGNSIGVSIGSGTSNVVEGNFFGLDPTGAHTVAGGVGITIHSDDNMVGGTNAAARNVFVGNGHDGTGINISGAARNRIQGNFIGTDTSGTVPLGFDTGIAVANGSSGTLIGGLTSTPGTAPGNVISANSSYGISTANGEAGTVVQGNLIGTDASGTQRLGNGLDGVHIHGPSNTIGGVNATARNVISANGQYGVEIGTDNASVHDVVVQNNFIGTDITGANLLGNSSHGVYLVISFNNTIESNVIAGNGGGGVEIVSVFGAPTGIALLGNSIFANGALGIDLGNAGVTANDVGDLDSGANNLQNFPILTGAIAYGGNVRFSGFLNSTPNSTFRLEFFANTTCDDSGFGEGEQFLGGTNVTTDDNGTNIFIVTFSTVPIGQFFSTTATDTNNNTSEFSPCVSFPPFKINGLGSQVHVSWNNVLTNFVLQSNLAVTDTNGWMDVPGAHGDDGKFFFFDLPHTNPAQFFRLRSQ